MFNVKINFSSASNPEQLFAELTKDLNKEEKPSFQLLFSSIHFVKNKCLYEVLPRIYDFFNAEVPLVGGTYSGFLTSKGCFVKGVFLLSFYSDEIIAFQGRGLNTKRNPEKAAKHFVKEIASKSFNARFKNNLVFLNISNGVIPSMPFFGRKRIINMPLPDFILFGLLKIANILFQYGVGREEEVLQYITDSLNGIPIISASSYDDNNSLANFQFYKNKIFSNAVVGLQLNSKKNFFVKPCFGLKKTNISFNIKEKKLFDCAFSVVNNAKAKDEILKQLKWPKDYLNEAVYRKTYYFPIGYDFNGYLEAHTIGLFLNNSICTTFPIKKEKVYVLSASGQILKQELSNALNEIASLKPLFVFGIFCTSYLETLKHNIYELRDLIEKYFGKDNYFVLFSAGEGIGLNNNHFFNHSIILTAIY